MPQPSPNAVHVDAILTNVSVAYMQSEDAFVADKVFPVVPVDKKTDKYFKYNKGDFFRDTAQRRGPGTESAGGGFKLSTDTYSADVWAYHKDIDDYTRANADSPINLDRDATRFITSIMMIRRERQWASDYFTTGVWGTDKTGNTDFTYWDDEAGSDPAEDIKGGRIAILKNTGLMPNTLVVGYEVHEALKKHPLIKEQFKYTSADSITEDMIARYLDIPRYIVARGVYNTANEGATDSMTFIHGKHALLCYAAPTPGLLQPSAGYTFVWRGLTGLNNMGVTISSFRMNHLKSDRIEIEAAFDCKVVASDCGYFFSGAVQ